MHPSRAIATKRDVQITDVPTWWNGETLTLRDVTALPLVLPDNTLKQEADRESILANDHAIKEPTLLRIGESDKAGVETSQMSDR
jgi:hypothetical protein